MTRILSFLFVFLLSVPAAQAGADIQKVEDYLNNMTTLQARFVQTDSSGGQLAGDFYLKRPGKMRFDYDDPVEDFVVADGMFIYYYDGHLKQQSNAPVNQSLASFFLRDDIVLSGDITVTKTRRTGGLLQITLAQTKDPDAGSLTLGFTENPLRLKKWRVIDAQDAMVEITLYEIKQGITFKRDLFHYYDPARKKPKYN